MARKAKLGPRDGIADVHHLVAILLHLCGELLVVAPFGTFPMLVNPERCPAVAGLTADPLSEFRRDVQRAVAIPWPQIRGVAIEAAAFGGRRPAVGPPHRVLDFLRPRANESLVGQVMRIDRAAILLVVGSPDVIFV
jgi:hypothetical protein